MPVFEKHQDQIKMKKEEIFNIIQKQPDSSLNDIAKYYFKKHNINYDTLSHAKYMSQANSIRYCLTILVNEKLIEYKICSAERGSLKKKTYRVAKNGRKRLQ